MNAIADRVRESWDYHSIRTEKNKTQHLFASGMVAMGDTLHWQDPEDMVNPVEYDADYNSPLPIQGKAFEDRLAQVHVDVLWNPTTLSEEEIIDLIMYLNVKCRSNRSKQLGEVFKSYTQNTHI
jgi:hypothetical protein